MSYDSKRKSLYRRFAIGYFGILGMILVALTFSVAQGAGWKPIIVGAPVYVTFLVAVTYQFIKELRALRQKEQEAEPSGGEDRQ